MSALLAHSKLAEVARGTFMPSVHMDKDTLAILVAIVGTTLWAYLYTWQSNEEVEEKLAGKKTLRSRQGTTDAALAMSMWDVIFGVGFLAVPVMTTGAAYDVCQSAGWLSGPNYSPRRAPKFCAAIAVFTLAAMGLNFLGINPMKALVFAGIVTNRRSIMGDKVNGGMINILGGITTLVIFGASGCLVWSWVSK